MRFHVDCESKILESDVRQAHLVLRRAVGRVYRRDGSTVHQGWVDLQRHVRLALHHLHGRREIVDAGQLNAGWERRDLVAGWTLLDELRCLLLLVLLLHLVLLHRRRLSWKQRLHVLRLLHGVHVLLRRHEGLLKHLRLLMLFFEASDLHGWYMEVGLACEHVRVVEIVLRRRWLSTDGSLT